MKTSRPLILLIFANDRSAYLDSVRKERQHLLTLLQTKVNELDIELKELDYSTIEGVIEALNIQKERLVMLHFAGHSGTDLLHLDEGKAHSNGLADKLGECPNLKFVFLNGCDNRHLVKEITKAGIPNVIGTRQPIVDKIALQFSQSFFQAFVKQEKTLKSSFAQAQTDVKILTGQEYRTLKIPDLIKDDQWAWFMESLEPEWKLTYSATPCNRLPSLPHRELPDNPFKNLYYYQESDAEIFFGRCRETLDMLQILDEAQEPILLLHGGTGVGKSSFLLAGLIPRLKVSSRQQTVYYHRYSEFDSHLSIIEQWFGTRDISTIRELLNKPSSSGLSSIWIIDQLEEIFFNEDHSQSNQPVPDALKELLTTLYDVFYPDDTSLRPQARIILSLRKEWFAELHDACREYQLNQRNFLLKPLNKKSIMEVVETISQNSLLQSHYRMSIANPSDGSLAERIADDLLVDTQSSIAPTLQIILLKLWNRVENQHERIWDIPLYLEEKRTGLLLKDHLDQQLLDIS